MRTLRVSPEIVRAVCASAGCTLEDFGVAAHASGLNFEPEEQADKAREFRQMERRADAEEEDRNAWKNHVKRAKKFLKHYASTKDPAALRGALAELERLEPGAVDVDGEGDENEPVQTPWYQKVRFQT